MVSMTLDMVIREMLIGQGVNSENKYAKYLQLGINGLRWFNMDIVPDQGLPSTVTMNVNPNQTCDLPQNYIDYVRIGILDNCGNFISLGYNPNIGYANPVNSCGTPVLPPCTNCADGIDGGNGADWSTGAAFLGFWGWEGIADNVRNNENIGRFFGLGGGGNPNGYYRVNLPTGQIQLGGVVATQVFMEYLADIASIDGEYAVHPYLVSALKRFIKYEDIFENDRIADSTKERARVEKFNEARMAKARFNVPRLSEIQAMLRRENKQTVRF